MCVPNFLEKLFRILEEQSSEKIKNENSKELFNKTQQLLGQFIDEFKNNKSRSLELSKEIIDKCCKFLKQANNS